MYRNSMLTIAFIPGIFILFYCHFYFLVFYRVFLCSLSVCFYVYIVIWAELPEINLMMMIKQSREKKTAC